LFSFKICEFSNKLLWLTYLKQTNEQYILKMRAHVMTLANSIIGVSILAMPFCYKEVNMVLYYNLKINNYY